MRTTLNIDEELLAQAQAITNITEKPKLIREALQALIERESAWQLGRLGGCAPDIRTISRRRF